MNIDSYIRNVLEENRLEKLLDKFRASLNLVCYVDRHVEKLPCADWPQAVACEAGLALLRAWHADSLVFADQGFVFVGPILVVDESWLEGKENPPPPHVMLEVIKRGDVYLGSQPSEAWAEGGRSVPVEDCPFSALVQGYIGKTEVAYLPPDPELQNGAWLVPPVSSIYRDGRFLPIGSSAPIARGEKSA